MEIRPAGRAHLRSLCSGYCLPIGAFCCLNNSCSSDFTRPSNGSSRTGTFQRPTALPTSLIRRGSGPAFFSGMYTDRSGTAIYRPDCVLRCPPRVRGWTEHVCVAGHPIVDSRASVLARTKRPPTDAGYELYFQHENAKLPSPRAVVAGLAPPGANPDVHLF